MNAYEAVLQEAADKGLDVIEDFDFESDALGMIDGHTIVLSSRLTSSAEKCCVLAEEIAHAEVSRSSILDMKDWRSRHEEMLARRLSHDMIVGIEGLIDAYHAGCQSRYEAAQYLDVTEEFLQAAIDSYIAKYGPYIRRGNYLITLRPIGVYQKCEP